MNFKLSKKLGFLSIFLSSIFGINFAFAQQVQNPDLSEITQIAESIKKAYKDEDLKSLISHYGNITSDSKKIILSILDWRNTYAIENKGKTTGQWKIENVTCSGNKASFMLLYLPSNEPYSGQTASFGGSHSLKKIGNKWVIWDNQIIKGYNDSPRERPEGRLKKSPRMKPIPSVRTKSSVRVKPVPHNQVSSDSSSPLINPILSEEKILERLNELIPLGTPEKEVRKFIKDHEILFISADGVTKGERDRGLNGFLVFIGSYKAFPLIPVSNNVFAKIYFDENGLLKDYEVSKIVDGP